MAGTLGANVLKKFDVEIDPGHGKVKLFTQQHCNGQVVYWPQTDVVRIPFDFHDNWINIQVLLDGKPIRAIIDTGATNSMLAFDVAKEIFQPTPDTLTLDAPDVALTLDGNGVQLYDYQFKTLQIGGITFSNPLIKLEADDGKPHKKRQLNEKSLALLIGMHQLRMLHLYIAYGEKVIYASTVRGDAAAEAKSGSVGVEPQNNLPNRGDNTADASQNNSPVNASVPKEAIISFLVLTDGSVGDIKLIKSSGSKDADDKVVDWYRNHAKYLPATKDGKPFDSRKTIRVVFKEK